MMKLYIVKTIARGETYSILASVHTLAKNAGTDSKQVVLFAVHLTLYSLDN